MLFICLVSESVTHVDVLLGQRRQRLQAQWLLLHCLLTQNPSTALDRIIIEQDQIPQVNIS